MEVTAIFFSCRRLHLLKRTVDAFLSSNTYPIKEVIIVNDSGEQGVHDCLRQTYPDFTLVLHPENVGLIKSIDLGYEHIKTEYFFHCEDDWMCIGKGGFIEQCLKIMEARPDIEEVWLKDMNDHPVELEMLYAGDVQYRLLAEYKGWNGFSTACALKRMSDYRKVAPYSEIPWQVSIWHREWAIGNEYFKLGYRAAVLIDEYVENIGIGQSEYVTGFEK